MKNVPSFFEQCKIWTICLWPFLKSESNHNLTRTVDHLSWEEVVDSWNRENWIETSITVLELVGSNKCGTNVGLRLGSWNKTSNHLKGWRIIGGPHSTMDGIFALYPAVPGLILRVPKSFSENFGRYNSMLQRFIDGLLRTVDRGLIMSI